MKKELMVVFFALAVLLLLVSGCKPKAPAAGDVTEENVQEIEAGISEIPGVEQELNTSELDSLEQELADIDALDI